MLKLIYPLVLIINDENKQFNSLFTPATVAKLGIDVVK